MCCALHCTAGWRHSVRRSLIISLVSASNQWLMAALIYHTIPYNTTYYSHNTCKPAHITKNKQKIWCSMMHGILSTIPIHYTTLTKALLVIALPTCPRWYFFHVCLLFLISSGKVKILPRPTFYGDSKAIVKATPETVGHFYLFSAAQNNSIGDLVSLWYSKVIFPNLGAPSGSPTDKQAPASSGFSTSSRVG